MKITGRDGDWQAGSIAFRRGWYATDRTFRHDIVDEWDTTEMVGLSVAVHPALGWTRTTIGTLTVLMIGEPIDLDGATTDRARISGRILEDLATGGWGEALHRVAYLGGRFVCMMSDGSEVHVIPDCAASMPVFWNTQRRGVALASHSHLLAEILEARENKWALGMLSAARAANTKGTLFLPGIETPFRNIYPLLANHMLRLDGRRITHQRFYPFPSTDFDRGPDSAYATFSRLFQLHTQLICGQGRAAISLTAGRDSQASFHAALPHLSPDSLTWTYRLPDGSNSDIEEDHRYAAESSASRGVKHQSVTLDQPASAEIRSAYARTFRLAGQHRRLAEAVYDQLPRDVVHLQSMIAEAGTGFYKNRRGRPTANRIAEIYSPTPYGRSRKVRSAMRRYLTCTDLDEQRLRGLDFHDAFYWEVRASRWAAIRVQELDLSHQVALPFNARGIIEALMGPALPDRAKKQALIKFVEDAQT